jgi:hypothetical protein
MRDEKFIQNFNRKTWSEETTRKTLVCDRTSLPPSSGSGWRQQGLAKCCYPTPSTNIVWGYVGFITVMCGWRGVQRHVHHNSRPMSLWTTCNWHLGEDLGSDHQAWALTALNTTSCSTSCLLHKLATWRVQNSISLLHIGLNVIPWPSGRLAVCHALFLHYSYPVKPLAISMYRRKTFCYSGQCFPSNASLPLLMFLSYYHRTLSSLFLN